MRSEAASSLYHFPPHSKEKWKEALPRSDFHFCKVFQTFYLFFLISETQSEWLWRSFSLLGSEQQWNERAVCWPGFSTYGFRKVLWESAAEIDKNPHSCVIKGTERAPRVAAVSNSRPLKGTCSPWEHREGLEERLSGDYSSKICHRCTKGHEKQISYQDIARSNPASRMLKLGLSVLWMPWFLCWERGAVETAPAQCWTTELDHNKP